ncbi:hypothetical protein ACTWP5_09130 [Streptomyces sp. 4N509B]|uniref:hypothetical protein n=1 Tax=Streptomyces sp. 4N509B TaxID=3457413 RepID=UPI003FCF1614
MTRQVRAAAAHEIPERAPLRLAVGDQVRAGERSEEWPAFVFVTASTGTGWVPDRHLSAPAGPAVVREAYDTTELPTAAGEILDVLREDPLSRWTWCRNAEGREGWVPDRTLERPDPADG